VDDAEERMCSLVGEILAITVPGPDEDFFALGGHSLLAVELVGRIRDEFGVAVPVRTVFDRPTPALLVAALRAEDPVGAVADHSAPGELGHPAPMRLRDWVVQN